MAILKLKNKNGTVYVYENDAHWDKNKKQARSKRVLIGKIDPKTGEMVPTRERRPNGTRTKIKIDNLPKMKTLYFCAIDLLNQMVETSGVLEVLKDVFPQSYTRLLVLVYYSMLEPDASYLFFDKWQQARRLPCKEPLSADRIEKMIPYVQTKYNHRSENENAKLIFGVNEECEVLPVLLNSINPGGKWIHVQEVLAYVRKQLIDFMLQRIGDDFDWQSFLVSLDMIGGIKDYQDTFMVGKLTEEQDQICEKLR